MLNNDLNVDALYFSEQIVAYCTADMPACAHEEPQN